MQLQLATSCKSIYFFVLIYNLLTPCGHPIFDRPQGSSALSGTLNDESGIVHGSRSQRRSLV